MKLGDSPICGTSPLKGLSARCAAKIKCTSSPWEKLHVRHKGVQRMPSPRFLCRRTTLYIFARAVERQERNIYTENSGFASPTLGQHISTFRGYRILFSIRNPYINRFTNHFSIHS